MKNLSECLNEALSASETRRNSTGNVSKAKTFVKSLEPTIKKIYPDKYGITPNSWYFEKGVGMMYGSFEYHMNVTDVLANNETSDTLAQKFGKNLERYSFETMDIKDFAKLDNPHNRKGELHRPLLNDITSLNNVGDGYSASKTILSYDKDGIYIVCYVVMDVRSTNYSKAFLCFNIYVDQDNV